MFWLVQVRDQLPHLKAIVQYKGKLSQGYENTYDVSAYIMALSALTFFFNTCILIFTYCLVTLCYSVGTVHGSR